MRVVIDTNVLLISLPVRSPYRLIFDAIINGDITLVLSNEILEEYQEILAQRTSSTVAENVIRLLLDLPNVEKQEIYFRFDLIKNDPDDNKFVDCAIAGNARYLVSEDKHFKVLKDEPLFTSEVLRVDDFLPLVNSFEKE